MRGPVPALGNASGSGPLDPGDSGTQYYNTNISWATSTDARGEPRLTRPTGSS